MKVIETMTLGAALLFLAGCASTLKMSDRRLVSITWVNPTPYTMTNIQTRINRTHAVFHKETLPPYLETGMEASILLPENPKVETKAQIGETTLQLPSTYVERPERESPSGEYNLRIYMTQGEVANVRLEPVHVTRARLSSVAEAK